MSEEIKENGHAEQGIAQSAEQPVEQEVTKPEQATTQSAEQPAGQQGNQLAETVTGESTELARPEDNENNENNENNKKTKKTKKSKKNGKKGKKSKKNRRLTNILLIIFICVGIFAGYNIIKIIKQYYDDQNSYNKISEVAGGDVFTGMIDFEALWATNPDVVAWLYRKDCKINYPVVQGSDNDQYLHHLLDGSYSAAGTLFVDYQIEYPFDEFATMIYGHHMKDSSMFGILRKYTDPEYAAEYSRFELITPTTKYHLDVVAFIHCREDNNLYIMNQSPSNYDSLIRNNANYTTGVEWTTDDRLVLMSTCAYEYEGARYILVGKLTPWTEQEIKKAELAQLKIDNAKKK